MAPETDEQLFLSYRATGDREMFAQLVYRYEREIFSYLRRYLGSAETAEDVFQTVFLKVHVRCQMFEEGRRFRPWLYSIATNAAIDCLRKNKNVAKASLNVAGESENEEAGSLINLLECGEIGPVGSAVREEQTALVRKAVSQLPESLAPVVQMVYFQGMRYQEVADVLSIPVGTVKSRLHAAINRLTDIWNSSCVD